MSQTSKKRLIYALIFILLVGVEVMIALFVHDRFIRPYVGDVIVVWVMYCFIRIFFPNGIKLLPLYLFFFSAAVEVAQYFDYVTLLGLQNSKFFSILLGTSFSFYDMIAYAAGTALCFAVQFILASRRKSKIKK